MAETRAKPRWRLTRFGDNEELKLLARWLGNVGPVIGGKCRYTTQTGTGTASTRAEAKRLVEAEAKRLIEGDFSKGKAYCDGILIRVICGGSHPFCAGLILDRDTRRVVIAAPVLRHLMGQSAEKLREVFKRLGWRATIVRQPDFVDQQGGMAGRLPAMRD